MNGGNRSIRILEIGAVLIVFGFVVGLYFGVMLLIEEYCNATKMTMEQAKKEFVAGNYEKARKIAADVNNSCANTINYANTMKVAIGEVKVAEKPNDEVPIDNSAEQTNEALLKLLQNLRNNANRAFKVKHWTTPEDDNVVLWTSQMLEIDLQNTFAKGMLEKVIDKYLQLYGGGSLQQLRKKLDTPVLPQTKLKDYANSTQRSEIIRLLGANYF